MFVWDCGQKCLFFKSHPSIKSPTMYNSSGLYFFNTSSKASGFEPFDPRWTSDMNKAFTFFFFFVFHCYLISPKSIKHSTKPSYPLHNMYLLQFGSICRPSFPDCQLVLSQKFPNLFVSTFTE